MKEKFLFRLVCVTATIAILIGDNRYSGMAIATMKEQQRFKENKEERSNTLENSFSLESTLLELKSYTTLKDGELSLEDKINQKLTEDNISFSKEDGITKEETLENFNIIDASESFNTSKSTSNSKSNIIDETNPLILGFNKYKPINNDTVGWIRIPDTPINYPIMYNPDNTFYLYRTPEKVSSKSGSIFLDQQSGGKWGVMNLVHGHNMDNDTVFGPVHKYMYEDFYNLHPYIEIYDGTTLKKYKVFSSFSIDGREEGIPIHYSTLEEYQAKIQDYKNRARFPSESPEQMTDILILNTCWYGDSGKEKFAHAITCAYRCE